LITCSSLSTINFSSSTLTKEQLYDTASYKNKDLSGINFSNLVLSEWDFTGQNLSNAVFTNAKCYPISSADPDKQSVFTDAIINGIKDSFLTYNQIITTASYKQRDLSNTNICVAFEYIGNTSYLDFSNMNLMNAILRGYADGSIPAASQNFTNSDIRGAIFSGKNREDHLYNTIDTDGVIKNLYMTSNRDNLIIRKYIPVTEDGEVISAKFATTGKIEGGATVTLKEGALAEITDNATITFASDSSLIIETSANNDTIFQVNSGNLVFEEGANLTINILTVNMLSDFVSLDEPINLNVIEWNDTVTLAGMEEVMKNANVEIKLNGETISGWTLGTDGSSLILTIVPEPSTYVAIFGAIALGFAMYRRRK